MHLHRTLLASLLLATLASPALAEQPSRYVFQLLTALPDGDGTSHGMAINASGLVAGQAVGAEGAATATTWAGPARTAVSLSGSFSGMWGSNAYGLNDGGTIVGTAYTPGGMRGFRLSQGGVAQELADLPGGYSESSAIAVNNAGVAVGSSYSTRSGFNPVATLWAPGQGAMELGDLPGGLYFSEANAINNAGQVVGVGYDSNGDHAFKWTATGGMVALDNLPGSVRNQAFAINDAGWIAGGSMVNGIYHATIWRDGQVFDLGAGNVTSLVFDINASGQMVGPNGDKPTLWTSDLQRYSLEDLVDNLPAGFELLEVRGINDSGLITGWALNEDGYHVGFVLTPVPEPGNWALMLAGLGVGGLLSRRRMRA